MIKSDYVPVLLDSREYQNVFKVVIESYGQIINVKFIHKYSKFKCIHICNSEDFLFCLFVCLFVCFFLQKRVQHDF